MPNENCPACGARGRSLQAVTVESLASAELLARIVDRDGFRYCPDVKCEVVWFQPATAMQVLKSEIKVRVGMKESAEPRPICYCFGHDAAEFEQDIRQRGQTDLPAEITGKFKQGLDRCEEMNPQGSCCLGNVNLVVQAARQKYATSPSPAEPFALATEAEGCCDDRGPEGGHE